MKTHTFVASPISYSFILFVTSFLLFKPSTSWAEDLQKKEASDNSSTKMLEFKNDEIILGTKSGEVSLKKHGEGVRKKKFAFINVDVYKVQLHTPAELLSVTDEFKILESKYLGLVLKPLRSFAGEKMKSSILDSFKANSIDAKAQAHQNFIQLISASKINKNEEILILGKKAADKDVLFLKRQGQFEKIKGHDGFVNEVFAIWLGKTSDSQLESLKQQLLGK